MGGLGADVALQALARFEEVAFTDDVVALEDTTGAVAQQHHRDPLRHTGPHEIASNR